MADEEGTQVPEIETIDMGDVPDKHLSEAPKAETVETPDQPVDAASAEPTEASSVAAESTETATTTEPGEKPRGKLKRLWHKYLAKKKLTIPLTIVLLLVILAAIPFTRFAIGGLVEKSIATVKVTDSATGKPVSDALVTLDGKSVKTDAVGLAGFAKVHPGRRKVHIEKKYYNSLDTTINLNFGFNSNFHTQKLVATGRQVPIVVNDKISGKPIINATISVAGTTAKTGLDGKATVVLPADKATQSATISADTFNQAVVTIQVSESAGAQNTFALVPSGKVYFLSKLSGKIDVVKTNLDGSDRQTVLAGTGNEDDTGTILLASRDWKYLALLSKREGGNEPKLYLISTSNDQITTMDQGDASFTLTGWSGHSFVYTVNRNGVQQWQPHAAALKTFDAETGKLTTVDQTAGSGTGPYDYVTSSFSTVYLIGDQIVYTQNLSAYYGNNNLLSGKQVNLFSASLDGKTIKTVKSFPVPANTTYFGVSLALAEPQSIYLQVPGNGNDITYYEYQDGQVKTAADVTEQKFDQIYPTYLQSPSGNTTFWSEERDGKNSLFTGDKDGGNAKQIAELSDYNTYGWYTDNYVLVSKNSSELYIMSAAGGNALKITDYHKPALSFYGYGGGYGGAQ